MSICECVYVCISDGVDVKCECMNVHVIHVSV